MDSPSDIECFRAVAAWLPAWLKTGFAWCPRQFRYAVRMGIVQLFRICIVLLGFLAMVSAQIPDDKLRAMVQGVRYSRLAEAAGIQGDIHAGVSGGTVTLLSGNPLLVQTALESAKALAFIQGGGDLDLTYHFVFVDTTRIVTVPRTVGLGNAFERSILRMLRLKTEKVVFDRSCQDGIAPPSIFKVSGAAIEIWIYGRSFCLMPQSAAPFLAP